MPRLNRTQFFLAFIPFVLLYYTIAAIAAWIWVFHAHYQPNVYNSNNINVEPLNLRTYSFYAGYYIGKKIGTSTAGYQCANVLVQNGYGQQVNDYGRVIGAALLQTVWETVKGFGRAFSPCAS